MLLTIYDRGEYLNSVKFMNFILYKEIKEVNEISKLIYVTTPK